MNYIQVIFTVKVLDTSEINFEMARDILIAELGNLNYESFIHIEKF